MERKEIIEFLKQEENIEWLIALNKFINSHIEFLNAMDEIENAELEKNHLKKETVDGSTIYVDQT